MAFNCACVVFCLRVDHLYTFFVQWSPDIYTKGAEKQGFFVVENDRLAVIDNPLHKKSIPKTLEVCVTAAEAGIKQVWNQKQTKATKSL